MSNAEPVRIGSLSVVSFQPSQLGLFALPLQGSRVTPVNPAEILLRSGGIAALNGPMFGVCPGQDLPSGNAAYGSSQCDTLSYGHYDEKSGLIIPSAHASQGITIAVVGNEAIAVRGSEYPPDASVAVQLYPSLVESGRVTASPSVNTDRVWRSALVILENGNLAFVVGQMSMNAFATAIVEIGGVYAGYTDGGGSTSLVSTMGVVGAHEYRPVASWLIVKPVSFTTIVQTATSRPWLFGIAAAVVAGGITWFILRDDS